MSQKVAKEAVIGEEVRAGRRVTKGQKTIGVGAVATRENLAKN